MKFVATRWKILKPLFWLAPILIIMGLTAGLVAGWSAIPLGLMGAGIAVLVAWLVVSGRTGFWGRRSTQAGTNALVATGAMLVILGLVNFLGARYEKRVDLTENQIFTLSPQTAAIVKGLPQPVKVWLFDNTPNVQDRELLENYRRQNSQLSYEYADPIAKPGLVQKFQVKSLGEVYLEAGDKRKLVQTITPAGQPPQPGTPEARLSERSLTNALAQLNRDRQKVYLLQGHGEKTPQPGRDGLSQALAQLEQENYGAEPLTLTAEAKVPDDAAIVLVAGPQRELLASEIKALQEYTRGKSGLMLLIDPLSKSGLNDLLKQWGVTLSDRVILDPSSQTSGLEPTVVLVNQYGDHPITKDFGNGYSLFPIAQPLQIDDVPNESKVPLFFAGQQVQAQKVAANGELKFDPNSAGQGPMAIGVALSRAVSTATPKPTAEVPQAEARMVVVGSSSFIADGAFGQQLNSDAFLNSINWLSQSGNETLSIRPKEMTNRRILLNAQQQTLIGGGALIALPLLGFGAAFFAWWRRR